MFRDAAGRTPSMQGPYDGLFSVIGTIMGQNARKRQEDKLYDSLEKFGTNLDGLDYGGQTHIQDLSSQSDRTGNYTNNSNEARITQGLLPTGFQTSAPTANMIGRGLLSGQKLQVPQQNFFNMPMYQAGNGEGMVAPGNIDLANRPTLKNADGSISTVRSMGVSIDGKEMLLPTVGPKGEDFNEQQAMDYYKQTGKNLGTFDSPESSNKYAESLHNQQEGMYSGKQSPLMGKYDKENNPANVTISPEKTYQEQIKMMKSQFSPAFKELRDKNPGVPAKELYTMLNQVMNDKIAEHKSDYIEKATQSALATLNGKDVDDRTAAQAAMRLTQLGVKIPSGFIAAYKNPNLQHVVINTGGEQQLKSFNPKTGEFVDKGSVAIGMSPYQQATLNLKTQDITNKVSGAYYHGGNKTPKVSAEEKHNQKLENEYVEVRKNLVSAVNSGDEPSAMRWMKEMNNDKFMTSHFADVVRSDGTALMNKWYATHPE